MPMDKPFEISAGEEAGLLSLPEICRGKAPEKLNTTELAFIGDSVYELMIRSMIVSGGGKAQDLSKRTISFVRAGAQAKAAKALLSGFLTEEEAALLKRARNHTNTSKPRSAGPKEYKLATGLEALVGYLYLKGETERLREIVREAVRIIPEEQE